VSFHFVLKRSGWGYDDLYEALKTGEKTSEWRDASDHWITRLLNENGRSALNTFKKCYEILETWSFLPYYWKYTRARFVVGYTKSPMLLAKVKEIIYHRDTDQFEIRIKNVVEAKDGVDNPRGKVNDQSTEEKEVQS